MRLPVNFFRFQFALKHFIEEMAGPGEKTKKWFNEIRKQKLGKNIVENQGKYECKEKKAELFSNANCYNCVYCTKIFIDPKFLIKHIFRRHSEKIIYLHKKLVDMTIFENGNILSADLINYLRTEFRELKSELEVVKQTISNYDGTETSHAFENPSKSEVAYLKMPVKKLDSSTEGRTFLSESVSNEPNKPVITVASTNNQDLLGKMDELFHMCKEDLMCKKEMEENLKLRDEKMCNEMKKMIASEMQNILHQEQKNNSERKMHISELQKDIKRLDEAIVFNSQRINSPETLQMLEKKFEQELKNVVQKSLLFDNEKRHINHKREKHHYNRKKGLYTANSQPFNEEKMKIDQAAHLRTSERRKSQGIREIPVKSIPLTDEHGITKFDVNEINRMVEEKLKSLNIDPRIEKLSPDEYEKKLDHLKSKREHLNSKFLNFSEIRDKMDSYVNKLVKSREKGKGLKRKLRFSSSSVIPSPVHESSTCNREATHFLNDMKVLTSPIVKNDRYAQGDCPNAADIVSDIENALVSEDKVIYLPKISNECNNCLQEDTNSISLLKNSDACCSAVLKCNENSSNTCMKTIFKDEAFCDIKFDSSKNLEHLSDLSSLSDLEDQSVMS